MKTHLLLLALQRFVKAALERDGITAGVFMYALPDDGKAATFPFVLQRLVKGTTDENDNEDVVALHIGVEQSAGDDDAGTVAAGICDTLRYALWTARILEDRFQLVFPLEVRQPDPEKKEHNFHMISMITRWNYVPPDRALGPDVYKTPYVAGRKNREEE